MSAEYQPITRIGASKRKLHNISISHTEIPEQYLYEACADVLASRGGRRWKDLVAIRLWTGSAGLQLSLGYRDENPDRRGFFLDARRRDGTEDKYMIEQLKKAPNVFELSTYNPVEKDFDAGINSGGLACARLYSLLSNAHSSRTKSDMEIVR